MIFAIVIEIKINNKRKHSVITVTKKCNNDDNNKGYNDKTITTTTIIIIIITRQQQLQTWICIHVVASNFYSTSYQLKKIINNIH